jgi:hypothetical protein
MDCLVKEAIKIWLHPDSFNRDKGFNLSHTWHSIINMLQGSRGMPMGNEGQIEVGMWLHPLAPPTGHPVLQQVAWQGTYTRHQGGPLTYQILDDGEWDGPWNIGFIDMWHSWEDFTEFSYHESSKSHTF